MDFKTVPDPIAGRGNPGAGREAVSLEKVLKLSEILTLPLLMDISEHMT